MGVTIKKSVFIYLGASGNKSGLDILESPNRLTAETSFSEAYEYSDV